MITKPRGAWQREAAAVTHLRKAAAGGVATARAARFFVSGLFCWCFAALWGFAALAGGLFAGSLPTLIGAGAMAAVAAWSGTRLVAKAGRSRA